MISDFKTKKINFYKNYLFWLPILTFVVFSFVSAEYFNYLNSLTVQNNLFALILCYAIVSLFMVLYFVYFSLSHKYKFLEKFKTIALYSLGFAMLLTDIPKFTLYPLGQTRLLIALISIQFSLFAAGNCVWKRSFFLANFLFLIHCSYFYFIVKFSPMATINLPNSLQYFALNISLCFCHTFLCVINDEQTKINIQNSEKIKAFSLKDSLTGAYRREFLLEDSFLKCESYSIAFIDLDNFKEVNDNYGHREGDEVLKKFVILLKDKIRNSDLIIRWGGDEFLLVLKDCNKFQAKEILKSLELNKLNSKIKIGFTCGIKEINSLENKKKDFLKNFDDVDFLMLKLKKENKGKIVYI